MVYLVKMATGISDRRTWLRGICCRCVIVLIIPETLTVLKTCQWNQSLRIFGFTSGSVSRCWNISSFFFFRPGERKPPSLGRLLTLEHVTGKLASSLGQIPFGFFRRKPAPCWAGQSDEWSGSTRVKVRVGRGTEAACAGPTMGQKANWFGEIQWPHVWHFLDEL